MAKDPTEMAAAVKEKSKKASPADKAAAASAKAKVAKVAAAAAEKEQGKARKAADAWLENTSKRINVVVGKIETYDGKADNFRATLSVHLAEAEEVCKGNSIKFKEWAEKNVLRLDGGAYSYGEIRRLVRVGNSDDPNKAIADMRNNTAARVKKHADKKRDADEKRDNADTPEPEIPASSANTVFEQFDKLSSKSQIAFLKQVGAVLDLSIMKGKIKIWPAE